MGSFTNVFSLYNPHPVDPVRSIGEGMSLRNAMQLNQERAAQADRLRIQNQQIQRNMDAQKAVASAISGATKQGEDGGYSTDWDAVDRALTDQGWGREAISMRKERREEMQAAYKALGEQMDASKKTLELTGQLLGAHPRVDWGLRDKDPIGFDTQLQQAKIGFGGLLAKGVSMKILSPQEAQQYAQLPYTPQLEQYLDTMANGALSRIQQVEKSRNELNDQVRRHLETAQINEAEARLPGIRADSAQKQTESGAMDLRGAIAGGPAAYSKVLQGLPPTVQGRFPAATSIDFSKPDQSAERVSRSALTPSQFSSDVDREKANDIRYENMLLRQQNEDHKEQMSNVRAGLTPNGQAVQSRFDQREDDKRGEQEYELHLQRYRLGDLLRVPNGETFRNPETKQDEEMTPEKRQRFTSEFSMVTQRVNEIRGKRGLKLVGDQNKEPQQAPSGTLASAVAQGPPQASVPPVAPAASRPQSALPEAARKELKEGKVTTFHNGQSWTLRNGTPVRLDK